MFSHSDVPGRYFGLMPANFGVSITGTYKCVKCGTVIVDLKVTVVDGVPVPSLKDLFVLELALHEKDQHSQHVADVAALCNLHKDNLPSAASLPKRLRSRFLECLQCVK